MEQFGFVTINPVVQLRFFFCIGIISKWSPLTSGMIIGTSDVHLWAELLETTGSPLDAYASSIFLIKSLSASMAQKTKLHCLEIISMSSSTEYIVREPNFFPADLREAATTD